MITPLLSALRLIAIRLLRIDSPSRPARVALPVFVRPVADPTLAIPATIRVDRAVQMSRAMVQAANALAACGDDLPEHLNIHATYPDGLSVMLGMSLLAADAEYPDDDDLD